MEMSIVKLHITALLALAQVLPKASPTSTPPPAATTLFSPSPRYYSAPFNPSTVTDVISRGRLEGRLWRATRSSTNCLAKLLSRGTLPATNEAVAVKRVSPNSKQGFWSMDFCARPQHDHGGLASVGQSVE
ncbi:hypothetical protein SUGI_0562800 [Cryptomeria japonica]|nr:hypothetical protein SUGI_0562800 [Cryptomeria japonica]